MTESEVRAIFLLAGIIVLAIESTESGYRPVRLEARCYASPWWRVETPNGPVIIGWRKRVISVDWAESRVRVLVTTDSVTKDATSVHAYTHGKAVEYLTEWRRIAVGMACAV